MPEYFTNVNNGTFIVITFATVFQHYFIDPVNLLCSHQDEKTF